MLAELLLTAALGVPYRDPRGRFSLDVPSEYALAPRFGETRGVRWTRPAPRRGQSPVDFEVLVRPSKGCIHGDRASVGDGRGWRRARADDGERWFLAEAGVCLEVRWSGTRRTLARERPVLRGMMKSLHPETSSPAPRKTPATKPSGAATEPSVGVSDLIGEWGSEQGSLLRLEEQGTFQMGAVRGRWILERNRLVLEGRSGLRRLRVHLSESALVLSGGGLDEPLRFSRSRPAGSEQSIQGRWRAHRFELWLGPDGRFQLGDVGGRWRVEGSQLILQSGPHQVRYQWRRSSSGLTLSGADLDEALSLVWVGAKKPSR